MQNQGIPAPRTVEALLGARAGRRRAQFVDVLARQLHEIAPGTTRVHIVPLVIEDRRRMWVSLTNSVGYVVGTSAAQCRAAHGLLTRAFPAADWSRPRTYNVATGELAVDPLIVDALAVPAELGLDTAPAVTA